MSNKTLNLYFFIDAFGWELYKKNQWFLKDIIAVKQPLRTIFGYTSACVPSIITGKAPTEHDYWSSFYYSPKTSPFRLLRCLDFLPSTITDSMRVRRHLSMLIAKICGFSGYFEIYNTPFKCLPYFDYQEKYDIYAENGMEGHETIFDKLRKKKISFFIGKGYKDQKKFEQLDKKLMKNEIQFAYMHLGELDSLLHLNKKDSNVITEKITEYDIRIRRSYELAKKFHNEINLIVFSDHGMKDVESTYNLMKDVELLNLAYGKDYVAFYDSTMARFWFLKESAKNKITTRLNEINEGVILSDDALRALGAHFGNHKYGDLIFLMDPGVLIVPSFMGKKAICGMHGYHPEDPDSWAIYLGNDSRAAKIQTITEIFNSYGKENFA